MTRADIVSETTTAERGAAWQLKDRQERPSSCAAISRTTPITRPPCWDLFGPARRSLLISEVEAAPTVCGLLYARGRQASDHRWPEREARHRADRNTADHRMIGGARLEDGQIGFLRQGVAEPLTNKSVRDTRLSQGERVAAHVSLGLI